MRGPLSWKKPRGIHNKKHSCENAHFAEFGKTPQIQKSTLLSILRTRNRPLFGLVCWCECRASSPHLEALKVRTAIRNTAQEHLVQKQQHEFIVNLGDSHLLNLPTQRRKGGHYYHLELWFSEDPIFSHACSLRSTSCQLTHWDDSEKAWCPQNFRPHFWAGNGCANFMGAWHFLVLSAGKPPCR